MAKLKCEINELYEINKKANIGWRGEALSLPREKLMLETGIYSFEKESQLFSDFLDLGL